MFRVFWFALFVLALAFDVQYEGAYIFVYYTMWTLMLETIYFGCLLSTSKRCQQISDALFPILMGPTLLVALGFWLLIAPFAETSLRRFLYTIIVHGLNALAMCTEIRPIDKRDVWKPVLYTITYHVFFITYVMHGGRDVKGKLPYWFAQYDTFLGWAIAAFAICCSGLVHMLLGFVYPLRQDVSKQCIV